MRRGIPPTANAVRTDCGAEATSAAIDRRWECRDHGSGHTREDHAGWSGQLVRDGGCAFCLRWGPTNRAASATLNKPRKRAMRFWIFIATYDQKGSTAQQKFELRMGDKFWGLNQNARNRNRI